MSLPGLKHPDELQDRDILTNMDSHRGSGVQMGDFVCKRTGETPFNFINKVKGEYRAWYNGKEAAANREARANAASHQAQVERVREVSVPPSQAVQDAEASLEDTVRSKVAALTERVSQAEDFYRRAKDSVEVARKVWHGAYAELRMAERFLKELEKQDGREYPPEVTPPVGGDLSEEVGYRKPKRSNRVGKSRDTQGVSVRGQEAHADDTTRTS